MSSRARFFLGGKGSWVHSLTAIAAPHNGTSFIECNADFTKAAAELATSASKALGLSKFKGVYDFQLDQFGIRKDDNETFAQALERVLHSDFLSHKDNAFLDLTIDKSLEINKGIAIQPNVYYFSYAGDQTSTDPRTGNHYPTVSAIPSNGMCALMLSFSYNMGKYYDKYTAGGIYIDKSWLPNDGLVNTVSALYPTHRRPASLPRPTTRARLEKLQRLHRHHIPPRSLVCDARADARSHPVHRRYAQRQHPQHARALPRHRARHLQHLSMTGAHCPARPNSRRDASAWMRPFFRARQTLLRTAHGAGK